MKNKKTKKSSSFQKRLFGLLLSPVSFKVVIIFFVGSFLLTTSLAVRGILAQEGVDNQSGQVISPPDNQNNNQMPPPPNNQMMPQNNGQMPPPPNNGQMMPPNNNQMMPPNNGQPQPYIDNNQMPPMMIDGQNQPPMNNQNNGQPMMPQQMNGQSGQGNNNQQMNEENRQKMDQQRLQMMKQNLERFIKEMARVKKNIASYEKKISIPEELKAAVAKIDEVSEKIKNSTDPDELEDVMSDFQDSVDVIQEWMPKLPRLVQLPKMIKQAEKELAKAEKAYNADKKKITSSKLDLVENLAGFRTAIDEQKAILDEAKGLVKTDPEEAMDKITDDFFGNMDNVWENEKVIQMALNLKKGMTQIKNELSQSERTIKDLKKRKIDTAELEAILNQAKSDFGDIKNLSAAKPVDYDILIEAIDNLMEVRQEFNDKVEELTGQMEFLPKIDGGNNFQMNIPQGFDMNGNAPMGEKNVIVR